ncbi:DUF742 domain-containing protein [Gandjariella thermophila]|nr:DUF742 domain-containing protein [Gandjariella thermophila]
MAGSREDAPWLDGDAGQLVRPYTVTNGRTKPSKPLDLVSLVRATGLAPHRRLDPEHALALELCRTPTSVAEIAAHLRQPVMVTKVVLSDLIEWNAVTTRAPGATADSTDRQRLEALLHGLRERL